MSKETETPTPETDAKLEQFFEEASKLLALNTRIDVNQLQYLRLGELARQLERQRDEARKYLELKDIAVNAWQDASFRANVRSNQLEEELTTSNARLREAIAALEQLDDYFDLGQSAFEVSNRFPFAAKLIKDTLTTTKGAV